MKQNMGLFDRIFRVTLVAIFVVLYVKGVITGALGWGLLGLSLIFLLTSLAGACPLYTFLGIRTCSAKTQKLD